MIQAENIVANNKKEIVTKLKELIGNSNLKNFSIEILMNQDQKILTSEQEIIVKVSKGKHSKIVSASKAYFVKRTLNAQEIISNQKVQEIIAKIKNKDILIAPNVSTQNQSEIQNAIKDQLKKENQTLNEDDLSKITINDIESLTFGKQIEVTLNINARHTIKKLKINVEKINLLKNSNITNGIGGTIFQDKFKNLWAMGKGTKLQILKAKSVGTDYLTTGWTDDNSQGLLNGSNITNGLGGIIFQDSFGNLWTMGKGTPLQVLKANDSKDGYVKSWTNDINQGLTNGSKIDDGLFGTIFQDKFKNLWAMSNWSKLQVLKVNSNGNGYVPTGWTNVNNTQGLTNGSNITNGEGGKIFQDSFGNLWTMGLWTQLQVLKANDSKDGYVKSWTNDINQGLTKGSNITRGNYGIIFQDSFKNLWTMGHEKKLQVLKANLNSNGYITTGWNHDTTKGLTYNSNITYSFFATIFQDSFKNLWTMSEGQKLQVLKVNSVGNGYVKSWTNINNTQGLLNASNITDGLGGTIFQDKFGNLWAMGNGTKLQVLKANSVGNGYVKNWTDVNNIEGLLNASNIIKSGAGRIFQDSFGNLWAMSIKTKLQVLVANLDNTGYINSWLYEKDKK